MQNFCRYLNKHRVRIINYEYHQAEQICKGWFCLGQLNLLLNRLTVELRLPDHNGNEKMCLKSLLIDLLTSMDYCLFDPPKKSEMLPCCMALNLAEAIATNKQTGNFPSISALK